MGNQGSCKCCNTLCQKDEIMTSQVVTSNWVNKMNDDYNVYVRK